MRESEGAEGEEKASSAPKHQAEQAIVKGRRECNKEPISPVNERQLQSDAIPAPNSTPDLGSEKSRILLIYLILRRKFKTRHFRNEYLVQWLGYHFGTLTSHTEEPQFKCKLLLSPVS